MYTVGIITEYNPLHEGHLRLMAKARCLLGPDTAVVCCMSGDFVQRGEFAVVRRQARARAAVLSGADLVLELPLPWAVSSAEGFAEGAVSVLRAVGVVDALVFGSESGDTEAITRTATLLLSPDFPLLLREELQKGDSFPAARQRAAVRLAAGPAAGLAERVAEILSRPNDTLAVEYCKALLRSKSPTSPLAVRREGAAHDAAALTPGQPPSAAALRAMLRRGETDAALSRMAPAMAQEFRREQDAGRAPVFSETAERAVLAQLRRMDRAAFAALDEGREGVGFRLYQASREAASVAEVLERAKTRRYPLSRLRRMVLWAYLGLSPATTRTVPAAIPYLRPLAASTLGQKLLARMRHTAALPLLIRPKDAKKIGRDAYSLFGLEARAADMYALAWPSLSAAVGGRLWREGLPPPLERSTP